MNGFDGLQMRIRELEAINQQHCALNGELRERIQQLEALTSRCGHDGCLELGTVPMTGTKQTRCRTHRVEAFEHNRRNA